MLLVVLVALALFALSNADSVLAAIGAAAGAANITLVVVVDIRALIKAKYLLQFRRRAPECSASPTRTWL